MPKCIYGIKDLKPIDREIYMIGLMKKGKNGLAHNYYMVEVEIEEIQLRTLSNVEYYDEKIKEDSDKKFEKNQCKNITINKMTPVTKLHSQPVSKLHANKNNYKNNEKNNEKNKVVVGKSASTDFELFKNKLLKILPKEFEFLNQNTVKNIQKFSKGELCPIRETLAYMRLNKKPMKINYLVAILKDGDYKTPVTPDKPSISGRIGKINYMLEHMPTEEINSLRSSIANNLGVSGHYVEDHLGNLLCLKYNRLQEGFS